jgi:hypothetical protein
MVRIRTIQVRLTRQQYERIKTDATVKGFSSLSAYMRHLALHRDDSLAIKICEMHSLILGAAKKHPKFRQNKNDGLYNSS